jgi:excinuclease ABC subunit C
MFDVKHFLQTLTSSPGVYQMFDNQGKIIYVGKAKNLKKRLSSYFRVHVDLPKTAALVKQIADIQIIITQNENEALLLENNLIKQYAPRYNILFKDDKSYPYLIFSTHEFPRLDLLRTQKTPKGEYFGPFSNTNAVRYSLQLIEKLFLLRNCSDSFFAHRSRPCLQYHIKRCSAPCVGLIDPSHYQQSVAYAKLFLQGKNQVIIKTLNEKMEQAADQLDFERAADCRDQIQLLRQIESEQSIQNAQGDFDVIAASMKEELMSLQLLMIRQGKIIGHQTYFHYFESHTSSDRTLQCDYFVDEGLRYFLAQYYLNADRTIPKEIFIQQKITDQALLSHSLTRQTQHRVVIKVAVRGIPHNLIKMAKHNAEEALLAHLANKSSLKKRFDTLAQALELPAVEIQRIECFDISHTFGEATVASCVVFDQNGPNKKEYRIFNINHVTAGDDFAAMHQVLQRRYRHAKNSETALPDIIVIDGGKGQLQQAVDVLAELEIDNIILLGIAKGPTRKAGFETIWRSDVEQPLAFDAHSPAIHLLQNIRDEAHRFAISKHRQKRGKSKKTSTLETIPGIGSKKRQALLKYFGGMQGVKDASFNALSKAPGIGPQLAKKIDAYLKLQA